jgi:hypothetical protein
MWLRQARSWWIPSSDPDLLWIGEHDGYKSLKPSVRHRRSVRLDPGASVIEITDAIIGSGHDVRLAFHLGPDVQVELDGASAILRWDSPGPTQARLELPGQLSWTPHRGETSPIMGWYSPALGQRVPAWTLLGSGHLPHGVPLVTKLQFPLSDHSPERLVPDQAVSLGVPGKALNNALSSQAEAG